MFSSFFSLMGLLVKLLRPRWMKSLLLVLLAYGQIIHVGGLQCRVGQTEVIPHGSSQPVCCMDITCSQGTQAEPCNAGDPSSSSCIPCPEGQYQTWQTTLSDRLTCSVNLNCTSNHKEYVIRGSSTTKSVCGTCLEGFKETGFHTCIENICPVGQEPEGNSCRWCSVGYFSDKEDNKPCKKRTICECMLIEGNETMDNKCSQDISLCSAADVEVDASTQSSPVKVNEGLAVGLSVGGTVAFLLIILVLVINRHNIRAWMRRNPDATSTVGSNNHRDIENGRQSDDVDTTGRPAPSGKCSVSRVSVCLVVEMWDAQCQ
ncbi:uncharacterized protein LOC106178293 [Lingula anatina]|uniref:Uncharacterized protein LOC106178293 n=1 Tax=Lingula anatina TaxID=7574 RepID=A0A1S3K2K6_LINAN|nr:uncharacterized protein LOC106178293 [Lingula anatina]|eukprot:XP_013416870.1 uncharacterized protein LOC106178293 [Lingula anatina]